MTIPEGSLQECLMAMKTTISHVGLRRIPCDRAHLLMASTGSAGGVRARVASGRVTLSREVSAWSWATVGGCASLCETESSGDEFR